MGEIRTSRGTSAPEDIGGEHRKNTRRVGSRRNPRHPCGVGHVELGLRFSDSQIGRNGARRSVDLRSSKSRFDLSRRSREERGP
jgi:hypothetical protein